MKAGRKWDESGLRAGWKQGEAGWKRESLAACGCVGVRANGRLAEERETGRVGEAAMKARRRGADGTDEVKTENREPHFASPEGG